MTVGKRKRLRLYEYKTAQGYKGYAQYERRSHYADEFSVRYAELRIEEQILRISERRKHAAEVGGDILHDEGKRHVLFFSRRCKHKISERQKRQQRHVVCDQHGADKCYVYKREYAYSCIPAQADDPLRENIEKADVFQRTYDRENAEKTGQRFQIKISEVLRVGRNDKAGYQRGCKRDHTNGVLAYKFDNAFGAASFYGGDHTVSF